MLRPDTCRTSSPLYPTRSPRPVNHPLYSRHLHHPRNARQNTQASKITMLPNMHVLRSPRPRASYHHPRLTRSRRVNSLLLPFCFLFVPCGPGYFLILTIPQHFSSPSILQLCGLRATTSLASLHSTYDSINVLDMRFAIFTTSRRDLDHVGRQLCRCLVLQRQRKCTYILQGQGLSASDQWTD